jgi:hypothetical protein
VQAEEDKWSNSCTEEETMAATTTWRDLAQEHRAEDLNEELSTENRNRVLAELGRLLEGRHFKGSKRCSEFLDYAVSQALKGNFTQLKERTLGVELFNRRSDYDTNSDPVVRATAGEIRKKIAQHYQESVPGSVQIALPVGTYIPRFDIRIDPADVNAEQEKQSDLIDESIAIDIAGKETKPGSRPPWALAWPIVGLTVIGATILCAAVFLYKQPAALNSKSTQQREVNAALFTFWHPFVTASSDTVAVFSDVRSRRQEDGRAIGKSPTGLSTGKMASPGISGVGEVMGVHALDEDFASFHRALRAKRSNFFTFDDAMNENVIFLGSPLANPPLRLLQSNRSFAFQIVNDDSNQPRLALINLRPQAGEPKLFMATPNEQPIKEDYALIVLAPGIHPEKKVLILAGITTFGTQAAAEFVSRPDLLKNLISHLRVSASGEVEPFEAVINVKIDDEVPVEERIVTIRQD